MSIVSSIFVFYDFSYTRSNTPTFLPRYGSYLDLSDDIILVVVDVLTVFLFSVSLSQCSRHGILLITPRGLPTHKLSITCEL